MFTGGRAAFYSIAPPHSTPDSESTVETVKSRQNLSPDPPLRKSRTETVLLELAYDGSRFHGLSPQPGLCTVHDTLKALLEQRLNVEVKALVFSARTDAGVTAEQNFATFRVRHAEGLLETIRSLTRASNPDASLVVKSADFVSRSINARTSASSKTYRYRIADDIESPSFLPGKWELYPSLNVSQMTDASQHLIGSHDFSSFRAAKCGAKTTVRQVTLLNVARVGSEVIITIAGDGFLRKMVRNIVGLLAEVGAGLRDPQEVLEILARRDRAASGVTAPARGLTLCQVSLVRG